MSDIQTTEQNSPIRSNRCFPAKTLITLYLAGVGVLLCIYLLAM